MLRARSTLSDTRNAIDDLRAVAHLALRQRRSAYMVQYFEEQIKEDESIHTTLETIIKSAKPAARRRAGTSRRRPDPAVD